MKRTLFLHGGILPTTGRPTGIGRLAVSMARDIAAEVRRRRRGQPLPVYVLHRQPLVLVSYFEDLVDSAEPVAGLLPPDREVLILLQLGWEMETAERLAQLARGTARLQDLIPQARIVFLANSVREAKGLGVRGYEVRLCHQNAFLDWDRYPPGGYSTARFDAVYVARITPFKRHRLACTVKSLYLVGGFSEGEREYAKGVLSLLQHATWKEHVWSYRMGSDMKRARVGLCLSEAEGGMFVASEYLLCGLPVVSTRALGGRDTFFTSENSSVVEADPEAVADAVQMWVRRKVDARLIREDVIRAMQVHRRTLVETVEEYVDASGRGSSFAAQWPQAYTHKLALRCRPDLSVRGWRLPLPDRPLATGKRA